MFFFKDSKVDFKKSFHRQLQSIFEAEIREDVIKFSFILPNNKRFPYIDHTLLHNELLEVLKSFFPLGVQIVYIVPNCNDDHYIDVGVLIKFLSTHY